MFHPAISTSKSAVTRSSWALLSVVWAILAAAPARAAVPTIPTAERNALIDLYNSTNGPKWILQNGWLGGVGTECGWQGVACDNSLSSVIALQLGGNNLNGTISSTIGSLTQLKVLELSQNSLSGPIPGGLWSLTGLTYLGLGFNHLTGTLPASIGNLTSLMTLTLRYNQLSGGLPTEIGNLTQVRGLMMDANAFVGAIPPSLQNLTMIPPGSRVTSLNIAWNALYSTDPALTSYLDAKNPGWQSTQTVAPSGLGAGSPTTSSIAVSWTPIAYTADSGFYEVLYATSPGGPFTTFGTPTPSKSSSTLTVTGLIAGTTYYFKVRTTTTPHPTNDGTGGIQVNTVTSGDSVQVPSSTGAPPPTATVSGSASICVGATTKIFAALTGSSPWNLTWSDGGKVFQQNGVTSSPATRSVAPSSSTTYTVTTVSNADGSTVGTGSAVITVNPRPATPVITAPSTATASQAGLVASVPNHSGSTYQWLITNGTITAGAATSTITFTAGASGSTGLRVVEGSDLGCASAAALASVSISGSVSISILLSPSSAQAVAGSAVSLTATISPVQSSATTVTLSSSAPSFVTVPASVVIASGASAVPFNATAVAAGAATITATLPAGLGGGSSSASVTVTSACPAPIAPVLSSASSSLVAGQSVAIVWTGPSYSAPGTYVIETSKDGFASIDQTLTGHSTAIIVSTDVSSTDSTLSIRVRAISSCGTPGTNSNFLSLAVALTPPFFAFTRTASPLIAATGGSAPSTSVELKNVGGVPGHVTFASSGGFLLLDKTSADVQPNAAVSVTLTAMAGAVSAEGVYAGLFSASYDGRELLTPVSLAIVPSLAPTGSRVHASVNTVGFSAPSGQSPASQTIELLVDALGTSPVFLTSAIGPGGSWLSISNALSNPVPLSGRVSLTLSVDRAKRSSEDSTSPLRTLLRITPVGGDPVTDSAVVEVDDVDTIPVAGGAGLRAAAPAAGTSFIIPTSVRASGLGGAFFASDGWLRNLGASPVAADLFYTPQGRDGNSDSSVQKCALTIPGGSTLRLSDLLSSYFSTNGTGQIELRSPSPNSLSLRTTVEATTGGDPATRYGTEIPIVAYETGVGLGDGTLAVPGIDDDTLRRANLILAETRGASVTVQVVVYTSDGSVVGTKSYFLPAYGKIQIDRIVNDVAPGASLSGGWLAVSVTAGSGSVILVATVIDNQSNSFSAVLGQGPPAPPAVSAKGGLQPLLASPQKFIVPAAVRARGAFTQFLTDLKVANPTGTPAILTLTYNYIDLDDGNAVKSAVRSVTIPARGTLSPTLSNDVIVSLFGVTNQSKGSITFEGAVAQVAASAAISAQVDPTNPSKGVKTAQINRAFLDSPDILATGSQEHRFAGCEKSIQKRTSLILLEVDGATCAVKVKGRTPTGETLAERTFNVAGGQYFQIVDLFGADGLNLGDGPFQNVEVAVQVTSGTGRVIALSTVNDNISQNPEIFILQDPGSTGPTTGF